MGEPCAATARTRMPFNRACLDKWRETRPEEDDWEPQPWRGPHPLIESHEELIDLHNYLTKGRELVGHNWPTQRQLRKALKLVEQLADLWPAMLREAGLGQ